MTDPAATLAPIAELLDQLGLGACLFDADDHALLWNATFLRLFPEHDGHVRPGEPYAANLRRFYAGRLDAAQMPFIDRYIADGIARHRRQTRPFEFSHRGQWLRVASLPVGEAGRMRVWQRIPPPQDGDTIARGMAAGGQATTLGSIEEIADGLVVRDADGRITAANQAFAAMHGLGAPAEAVGLTIEQVLARAWGGEAAAAEVLLAWSDNARFAGAPFELPLPGDRWVRVSEHRAPDGSLIGTHVDVTDLHRLHLEAVRAKGVAEALAASLRAEMEERRRAEAALARAQRAEAIGQLSAGVAHDFNNLFSMIVTGLDLIELDGAGQTRRDSLGVIRTAVERGAALTAQLLAFARRQPLVPRPVMLGALVGDLLPLLQRACGAGVRVRLEGLEAGACALVDPTQLELGLLNLAINAGDAMPRGGTLRISIGREALRDGAEPDSPPPGDYAVISFADTGTGMDEAVLARAFEPFFTTKAPGEGSGLGLSQVYGLARQSGGTVRIESRPGGGTTVRVLLPMASPRAVAAPAPAAPAAAGPVRVLLVEDEPGVRSGLASLLSLVGFEVTAHEAGAPALRAAEQGLGADILVTDVRMPGMSGPELAQRLRELRPGLPVVFVTGFAEPEALAGLGEGWRLLRKPCRAKELLDAIGSLMPGGAAPG